MIFIATQTRIDNQSKKCQEISNVLAEMKICQEFLGPLIFLVYFTFKERKKLKTDRI
jgi:hypothetical protein